MSHDDELRNRVGRLADAAEIPELTFEDIEHRGQRRVNRQRILAVAAAFMLVVGAVGAVKLLDENGSKELDVAGDADVDTETSKADDSAGDTADAEATAVDPTATRAVAQGEADFAYGSYAGDDYAGPNWILPWQGGFVSLSQVFEPSDATLRDLVPDIEERLGADVLAYFAEVGLSVDDLGRDLEERLYSSYEPDDDFGFVEEALWSDPVVSEALQQVLQGGTLRPEASVSPDGEDWTVVKGFALPGDDRYFSYVKSDGGRLLVANQTWDESTGENGDVTVSHTTDLLSWTTTVVPVEQPDVPSFVQANVGLGSVELIEGGWYATTSTWSWVDLWSAMPADIIEELDREGWGWEPAPEGVRIVDYSYWEEERANDTLEASYPTTIPGPPPLVYPITGPGGEAGPAVVRVIPWSDLGMTWDDYLDYNNGSDSTSAWIGTWDGAVTPGSVPVEQGCCTIMATDAGLIAQAWNVVDEPAYYEGSYEEPAYSEPPAPLLFFSADGQSWTEIDGPEQTGWYDGMAAVEGGVLLLSSSYEEGGDEHQSGQIIWRGDADGSNWQQVEIPGLDAGTYLWFGQPQAAGMASVIDLAQYEYEEYEAIERPLLTGLQIEFEAGGNTFDIAVDDEGFARFLITDAEGTVLVDQKSDWEMRWPEDLFEASYSAIAETGTDEDFFRAFEDSFDEVMNQAYAQAEEIHAEAGFEEPIYPEYLPDFWLVATVDGLTWLVEDLDDSNNVNEGYYNATPGISGNTVAVALGDQWTTYTIG
jgi:hypothetical protein